MALIHHRGFVLTAASLLPINKHTLVYGSGDAGKNVHNDDEALSHLMKTAAYRLKLTERLVQGNKMIAGPTDIGARPFHHRRQYVVG